MTNQTLYRIAVEQSARDSGCDAKDFCAGVGKVVLSRTHPGTRAYLQLPFACDLTSYGRGIVASVSEELRPIAEAYIQKYPEANCFETPHMHVLNESLKPYGLGVCFMAEYFLPDVDMLRPLSCAYPLRLLQPKDFADCYQPQWENALSPRRRALDRLAFGAFDGERLVGLAGCSEDCASMWQIGVDVLPAYRGQGVASAVTSHLGAELLRRGIVPFYCCAWSNLGSARNAIRSGFRPAWVQMTAKSLEFVADMNSL